LALALAPGEAAEAAVPTAITTAISESDVSFAIADMAVSVLGERTASG
jgi:hypothetical protein